MELMLNIRDIRKARGLSLAQLAERVGVSSPHMSGVELGKKNLNNHLIVRIAAALDVDPSALIGQSDGQWSSLRSSALGLSDRDFQRVLDFAEALATSSTSD